MKIIEVTDNRSSTEFLLFPVKLYKNTIQWIRPLDKDIKLVFDPGKNKAFRNGECTRWILHDDNGNTIGRVAAFVNDKTKNKGNDVPTGGIGFFECIENEEAAFLLFDQCKTWLEKREIKAMDGPINFGERDKWWGLLIDGFDREPNYNCNYQPAYYKLFFEKYGFQIYFKQLTFGRDVFNPFSDRIKEKAKNVFKDPNYHFEHLKTKNIDKYTEDFRTIYNKAWAKIGVPKLSSLQAKTLMKQLKPILDEKIIWYGYYKEEPIAIYMNIPEINQIFKHVNGKMNVIGKIKFLYHKLMKTNKKMLGLVYGIVPEFHGKGVDGALIVATGKMVQVEYPRYPLLEMNWIGDFNPKMIRVAEQLEGVVVKTHATYRKLFDPSIPFKRMKII
jgi:hypothetical protein